MLDRKQLDAEARIYALEQAKNRRYQCILRHSADQACSSGTEKLLAFDTEDIDYGEMHDTVTNNSRITIRAAGRYLVGGNGNFATSALGNYRQLRIRLNGTTYIAMTTMGPISAAANAVGAIVRMRVFDVGDYIELGAVQDIGSNLNFLAVSEYSPVFWAMWLG